MIGRRFPEGITKESLSQRVVNFVINGETHTMREYRLVRTVKAILNDVESRGGNEDFLKELRTQNYDVMYVAPEKMNHHFNVLINTMNKYIHMTDDEINGDFNELTDEKQNNYRLWQCIAEAAENNWC